MNKRLKADIPSDPSNVTSTLLRRVSKTVGAGDAFKLTHRANRQRWKSINVVYT